MNYSTLPKKIIFAKVEAQYLTLVVTLSEVFDLLTNVIRFATISSPHLTLGLREHREAFLLGNK